MVFEKVRPGAVAASPSSATRRRLPRWAPVAVGTAALLLAIAGLVAMLSPGSAFDVAPSTTSGYSPIAVAVLMMLAAAAVAVLALSRPRAVARFSTATRRLAWIVFVAACLAAQLVLAHAVLQMPTWDATMIFEVAYHQAVAPEPRLFPIGDQVAYFALYPNNAFLVAVFTALFGVLKAFGLTGIDQYLWASVVVNCIALTGALVLVRFVAARLLPGVATVASVVLGTILVVVSPWLNVAYSDTLAMVFPIGMLAIWLVWPERESWVSRAGLFAVLGAVSAVGFAVKPPVVAMTAALLVVTAWSGPASRRLDRRSGLLALAGLAVGFGLAHVVVGAVADRIFPGLGPSSPMPFTHFMAMGATGDGGFNAEDFDRSFAESGRDRVFGNIALFGSRVLDMGPIGYPLFLAQKALYALSDGSFFQDREGIGPYSQAFLSGDAFSTAVQDVFPLSGSLHWVLASVWQAAWWCTVLLCFVPLRRLRLPKPAAVLAMRLSVLFLLAYLLLSESRSRYLYHYLPVLLVLAGLGAAALVAELRALRARRAARIDTADS